MSSPSSSKPRRLLLTGLGFAVAGAVGILIALTFAPSARSASPRTAATGAYRPELRASREAYRKELAAAEAAKHRRPSSTGRSATADDSNANTPGTGGTAAEAEAAAAAAALAAEDVPDELALPPELEARLVMASRVSVVPAPGTPLSPSAEDTPPETQLALQHAMTAWHAAAQTLLDRCVARPAGLRQPAHLSVIFSAPMSDVDLVPQRLDAMAVSLATSELRRLWQDTDPDELQRCLEELRGLPIVLPAPPNTSARVLPSSIESLNVQL